ncbi:SLC13 family permease [uncultured Acinetobacter sp.]|uniref:SLC13 family permease n=1 Tax=uncultured Acinetobacter sp. TaxID=165433 RepID=UPI0026061636|nr:SLC13 family permease [uncultured Acinetobacter sp.]
MLNSLLRFPLWSIVPLIFIYLLLGITARHADVEHHAAIITLTVFLTATWLWICSKFDETYIAVLAVFILITSGTLKETALYLSWGQDIIWLLIAAFVIAAGVVKTGIATYCSAQLLQYAHSPRMLCYTLSLFIVFSAFIIPSTSGRAAIILPIFLALLDRLHNHPHLIKALSLLCPSIILLSAVASYFGAGAHLITNQILLDQGYASFSLLNWLWLGLPFALISSLACTELILRLFTTAQDRSLSLNLLEFNPLQHSSEQLGLSSEQKRIVGILALILGLWFLEPWHHISTTMVALLGALLMATPGIGCIKFSHAIKSVPWSLLIFMAATLTMGAALIESGAVTWLTQSFFAQMDTTHWAAPVIFTTVMIVVSLFAHLFIQSRSARSVVLIPIVVSLAPQFNVSPVAMAFVSTAAAGFCHSLTSSAKPIAIFHQTETQSMFNSQDLLKLSFYLAPIMFVLLFIFTFLIWPLMGMPIWISTE